jgi:hypothetical protein
MASCTETATFKGPDGSPRFQLLVDDDGIAHYPWMTVDQFHGWVPELDDYGWYSTLCEKDHPGPLVLCIAITCIECLVKHA